MSAIWRGSSLAAALIAAATLVAEESTTGVLRWPVDRGTMQRLAAATEHLQRGETAQALPVLETLWRRSSDELVGDGATLHSLRERVVELTRRLPADEQRRFWQQFEATHPADPASPTRFGLAALWRRAAALRDRGDVELAAAAFGQAARHPAATPRESLLAEVQRVDAQAQWQGPGAVYRWLSSEPPESRAAEIAVAGRRTTVEAWLRERTAVRRDTPAAVQHHRPALPPVWRRSADIPRELQLGLEQAADLLRMQGLIRLPAVRPVVVGSRILIRTPQGLDCVDASAGTMLWTTADAAADERATTALQQQNPLFRQNLLSRLSQQMQTNTLVGALSHDDDDVYQVIEQQRGADAAKPIVSNALAAYDLASGRLKWRIGGAGPPNLVWRARPRTSDDPNALVSVCGPPLVMGRHLYLLCERAAELMFLAIDKESLEVEWFSVIGDLLPNMGRLTPRAYAASPLLWTGDLIVCGANCGAVAGLDPVAQRLRWVTRLPVDVWSTPRPDASAADLAAEMSLRGWREASLHACGDRVVCFPPESQAAYVLDVATGQPMAMIPRDRGLKCLGVTPELVVILEPTAVRAHDPLTGDLRWRTVVGEIRGQGVVTGDACVQPLDDGSLAVIDLHTGRRLPGILRSDVAWGNLVPVTDGWLSGDEFRLLKFADLSARRNLPSADDSPAAELARAEWDLQAGDFASVRQRLIHRDDDAARMVLRAADLAELRFAPERAAELREGLLRRSTAREERGEALFALAEAALHERRLSDAAEHALAGLDLGLSGDRRESGESIRIVRWDRAFQGLIASAFHLAHAQERSALEQSLAARWASARDSGDPFAVQQLHQRWRSLPWTRRRFLDDAERVFLGANLLARELTLREAMEHPISDLATAAAWKLREEWHAAGFPDAAEDIDLRLLQTSPGRLVGENQTVRQQLAERGVDFDRLHRRLVRGPNDPWPNASPQTTETKDFYEDAYQMPLPIDADDDPFWDRIDVTVDRQGRVLRFTGGDAGGAWTLTLPRSNSALQQYPYTYQAWGRGRLLIARIGTQLLAVTPLDEHGAAKADVVWSLDLLGPGQQLTMWERLAAPWKQAAESFRVLDQYRRDLGLVGPVRHGYLCYCQQGKLIAVETQTGRRLWERRDTPPGVVPLGDNDHVLLWQPDRNRLDLLAAADGRTIGSRSVPFSRSDVWRVQGSRIGIGRVDAELTLAWHDLVTEQTIWQRTFPKESVPATLDARTLAVIDPRGVLYLVDSETGASWEDPLTLDVPPSLERVVVCRDEARWYLGLSGPVERSLDWQVCQPLNSFRRPLLQGPLYAVDRASRQIVWKRDQDGSPWPLDQNRAAPVLTQIYKIPPPSGQAVGEGVLRLIDKRTGRDVFLHRDLNLVPNYALEPNAELQQLEIRTERAAFQLDYSPPADQ